MPVTELITELVTELRRTGVREVSASRLSRSLYSSDASLYRVEPRAVVWPHDADEVVAVLETCRRLGLPLTSRGAGTSIAGNAVGPGVVLDFSRHMHRVLALDPESATARVEPGLVQSALQQAAAPHGLRFGPDPSSHNRATIGGMIGNNACGSRALGYGRTADNTVGLDLLTGTGNRLRTGTMGPDPGLDDTGAGLDDLVAGALATIRTEFGRFTRQVSGYSLEHLLPENGGSLTRTLVGSEGTLAVTLAAEVKLVRDAPHRVLVALGYPDMASAGDGVVAVLPHGPTACEGMDRRIVDVVRQRRGPQAVPPLPEGSGWLFVELVGDSLDEAVAAGHKLAADAGALDAMVEADPGRIAALWRIREDGAGLSSRSLAGAPAHAGWEDAAVPPPRLGAYLREFDALLLEHGLTGLPYGHFGDGCLHIRIDFPLDATDGTARFRSFLYEAGRLAAGYGGSMSGEHGDGRARSELLPLMYSPEALGLFSRLKGLFDPDNLLNPGVIVDPAPLDAGIRMAVAPPVREGLALAFAHDRGDFSAAVHRCSGVGKCRADTTATGGVMCPSYLATREEKDSTRGRARVLQDMVAGHVKGWRAPEVHEALDLCLACKGCASDCPTGVDMASYKAEVLHQAYRRRLRPRSHYALGQLPRWAALASRMTPVANAVTGAAVLHRLVTWSAGVDARRSLPAFASPTFRRAFVPDPDPDVLLFVDTFTDHFSPAVGHATVEVLRRAGYRVGTTAKPLCCGLTWISTGQLDGARRRLRRTVDAFGGTDLPIVGIEPSCTAVLRSDAAELVDGAQDVAARIRTLAELLSETPGWEPPDLSGVEVVAQPHCHHHAVLNWSPDAALLARAGASVQRLGGCCGLAGNFGVERGHHDVSVAVAGNQLLPAVSAAAPDAVVLADGFSCRTQLDSLTDRSGTHLAQLLAGLPPARN